jgi:hypothetical protein
MKFQKTIFFLNIINYFTLYCELSITSPYYPRYKRAISGSDCKSIPKDPNAGNTIKYKDDELLVMHNGIKVLHKHFHRQWQTEVIKKLQGHHEPQQEYAFFEVLKKIPPKGVMIEIGSFWSYYSMWFNKKIEGAQNYMIEPNIRKLNLGKKHFEINNLKGNFINAWIDLPIKKEVFFDCDGLSPAKKITIDQIIESNKLAFVDIIHSDIQGSEYNMLLGCKNSLAQHKIGYFFISTHGVNVNKKTIHQACIEFLKQYKFRIIASHTPAESFSDDGLIVAQSPTLNPIPSIKISKFQPIK